MIDKLLDYKEKKLNSEPNLIQFVTGLGVILTTIMCLKGDLNKNESKDLRKINTPYQQERIQDKPHNYNKLNNTYVQLEF